MSTIDSWFAATGSTARLIESGTDLWDVEYASISLINLATLREIGEVSGAELDPRRFRAYVYLDGLDPWEEFTLGGRTIRIGGAVLQVLEPIVRRRATSVAPDHGGVDVNVPGILNAHFGHGFCGMYAKVVEAGMVSAGDSAEQIDDTFVVPTNAQPEMPRSARVVAVQRQPGNATSVELDDSYDLLPTAAAGQHLKLHRHNGGAASWRSYTISKIADTARITAALHPDGGMSPWVSSLAPGDTVYVSGPFGDAVLDSGSPSPLLLLTAGIGITPALAVAQALGGTGSQRMVDFVHVDRSPHAVAHADELSDAITALPRATLHLYSTRAPSPTPPARQGGSP